MFSNTSAANSALQYLTSNSLTKLREVTKLVSGSRIAKESNDAVGLAVGPAYNVQLSSSAKNASEASAILQVADGGLAKISDVLQRMKSLATQSASGTVNDAERGYIQQEFGELTKEITSVADATRYNNQSLLNNSDTRSFNIGTNQNDTISITLADVSAAGLDVDRLNSSSQQSSEDALEGIKSAIEQIKGLRAYVGAKTSAVDFGDVSNSTMQGNTAAANPASGNASISSPKVINQAAVARLAQANQMPQNILGLLG